MGCCHDIVQDYYPSLLCLRLKGRMVVRGHTDSTGGGRVLKKSGLPVL